MTRCSRRRRARALERCLAAAASRCSPTDTVYGLAATPRRPAAVARLYAAQAPPRRQARGGHVLRAGARRCAALPELGRARRARRWRALLPGPVTLLLPNPARPLPARVRGRPATLGLRVPRRSACALAGVRRPVLQSSANLAGGARRAPPGRGARAIRAAADLVLDGGELPGAPSTVVDLRDSRVGRLDVVREGADRARRGARRTRLGVTRPSARRRRLATGAGGRPGRPPPPGPVVVADACPI